MIHFAEHSTKCEPVNLGTSKRLRTREIAAEIKAIAGSSIIVRFEHKGTGNPCSFVPDVKKAKALGFEARVRFKCGVSATCEWYAESMID
jgi:nucleoside-diphosphate-sugar epimerase